MYLYLLENKLAEKFYIGCTNNLHRRLSEHNFNKEKYTGRINGEWKLMYNIKFNNETAARKEEVRLKKAKNKKYILWYFKNRAASSIGRATPS